MSFAYVVVGQLGKNILGDDSDVQVLKIIVCINMILVLLKSQNLQCCNFIIIACPFGW